MRSQRQRQSNCVRFFQMVLRHFFPNVLLACAAVEKNPDKPALCAFHMGGQFPESNVKPVCLFSYTTRKCHDLITGAAQQCSTRNRKHCRNITILQHYWRSFFYFISFFLEQTTDLRPCLPQTHNMTPFYVFCDACQFSWSEQWHSAGHNTGTKQFLVLLYTEK